MEEALVFGVFLEALRLEVDLPVVHELPGEEDLLAHRVLDVELGVLGAGGVPAELGLEVEAALEHEGSFEEPVALHLALEFLALEDLVGALFESVLVENPFFLIRFKVN